VEWGFALFPPEDIYKEVLKRQRKTGGWSSEMIIGNSIE
jgi:hypothetical protein